jgi:hypothetical protein
MNSLGEIENGIVSKERGRLTAWIDFLGLTESASLCKKIQSHSI